jgi:hypothetical protein
MLQERNVIVSGQTILRKLLSKSLHVGYTASGASRNPTEGNDIVSFYLALPYNIYKKRQETSATR